MRTAKLGFIVMVAGVMLIGFGGVALAFHDGGVAHCDGCHTMHNSQNGQPVANGATSGAFLTKGSDSSSTCLNCHAGYGQKTADGTGFGSGGDYYWLTKTFSWDAHGTTAYSTGESHGHSIIAADFGPLTEDQTLTTAPGGTYDASYLGCNSCHDPHGKQGNELLLYGAETTAANYPGGYSFTEPAPILNSPGRRTSSNNAVSDTNHTAFGSGVSAWCGNCHGAIHEANNMHPVDQNLGSTIAGNYNAYVSTDNPTGGVQATAYWEIVPFENGLPFAQLDINSTAGPDQNSTVMCLTCHRAHASAFPDSGRWYFGATLINEESHPLTGDGGADANDVANKYYGRVFDDTQRSLCNKCHVQDHPV